MEMEGWTRMSSSFTNKQSFSVAVGGTIQGGKTFQSTIATKKKDVFACLLAQYNYTYKEISIY